MENQMNFKRELLQLIGEKFTFHIQKDKKGVTNSWCRLEEVLDIKNVALLMKKIDGRLITVTASNIENNLKELVYHFDLDGDCCNVVIQLSENKVESITPILKTADWTERELKELYDIEIIGHPNPKRLFLEETIEEGVMNSYISLSEAMNGASSQTLWEKVITETSEEK